MDIKELDNNLNVFRLSQNCVRMEYDGRETHVVRIITFDARRAEGDALSE